MDPSPSFPPPRKNKNPSPKPHNQKECTAIYLYTITSFLLLITIQSLAIQRTPTNPPPLSSPRPQSKSSPLTFHPLKDPNVPPYTDPNRTWFMSTLTGRSLNGMPEHFVFPSHHPNNKILCINTHNKSYALAASNNAYPSNITVIPGLTVVVDGFYDYENPWHGLNSIAVFFSWMRERGCMKPSRFVVFRNGEVVKRVGSWVLDLMRASLGSGDVEIERMEGYGVACFEKAVVFRRGLGKMSSERRHGLFEMLKCKAWRYCNVSDGEGNGGVRISLVGREGKRGFKNESGVRLVMERECGKVGDCSLKLIHLKNMSFCDQVRAMRNTNILASTHGAHLTNMMFMPKRSSVMEMFPTGWLEGAGIGQFIYQWFASWSEMRYEGAWRDNGGLSCSKSERRSKCFLMQKDQKVGLNETYLAEWTATVIKHIAKDKRLSESKYRSMACSCDD